VSFKIITTTSVTRSCFTKQHQTCKTKTAVCKTKTDFFWYQIGLVLRPTASDHITATKGVTCSPWNIFNGAGAQKTRIMPTRLSTKCDNMCIHLDRERDGQLFHNNIVHSACIACCFHYYYYYYYYYYHHYYFWLLFSHPIFPDYSSLHWVPHRSPEVEHMEIAGVRFSTAQMPFLLPNQQCQSTDANRKIHRVSVTV